MPASNLPVRDEAGRFPKGQSGNPLGRPMGRRNELTELRLDMEIAVRKHVKSSDIQDILDRLVLMAKAGNVKAAKLVLEPFLSKARDSEDGQESGNTYVFRIDNATFGARDKQAVLIEATEAEVIEET